MLAPYLSRFLIKQKDFGHRAGAVATIVSEHFSKILLGAWLAASARGVQRLGTRLRLHRN
jgi:hypothetical protein